MVVDVVPRAGDRKRCRGEGTKEVANRRAWEFRADRGRSPCECLAVDCLLCGMDRRCGC